LPPAASSAGGVARFARLLGSLNHKTQLQLPHVQWQCRISSQWPSFAVVAPAAGQSPSIRAGLRGKTHFPLPPVASFQLDRFSIKRYFSFIRESLWQSLHIFQVLQTVSQRGLWSVSNTQNPVYRGPSIILYSAPPLQTTMHK
jgi:hypothetical protein